MDIRAAAVAYMMRPSSLSAAALRGVGVLGGVAVYSALAQILILPPVFDLVAALLFGVIGMVIVGLPSVALLLWLIFPFTLLQLQSMALTIPLVIRAGDIVETAGMRVHADDAIVVTREFKVRRGVGWTNHYFAPVAPPDWRRGDPVAYWAYAMDQIRPADPQRHQAGWQGSQATALALGREDADRVRGVTAQLVEQSVFHAVTPPVRAVQWQVPTHDAQRRALIAWLAPLLHTVLGWLALVGLAAGLRRVAPGLF